MAEVIRPGQRLKVVSDGTGRGTHLVDPETGEEVLYGHLNGVRWEIDNRTKKARLFVELIFSGIEAEGEVAEVNYTNHVPT